MQVVPALLYVFAVFYGGLIPAPHVPGPQISYSDKVLHALAFGFMHWVFYRALRFALPRRAFRFHNVAAFVCVTAAGGLLELLQLMTSYRSAEVLDFLADALGAAVAAWVLSRMPRAEETCEVPPEPEG